MQCIAKTLADNFSYILVLEGPILWIHIPLYIYVVRPLMMIYACRTLPWGSFFLVAQLQQDLSRESRGSRGKHQRWCLLSLLTFHVEHRGRRNWGDRSEGVAQYFDFYLLSHATSFLSGFKSRLSPYFWILLRPCTFVAG